KTPFASTSVDQSDASGLRTKAPSFQVGSTKSWTLRGPLNSASTTGALLRTSARRVVHDPGTLSTSTPTGSGAPGLAMGGALRRSTRLVMRSGLVGFPCSGKLAL